MLAGHLGVLFLDEPTHNLDSLAVERLAEMMKTNLPGLIGQIFLITHQKEMEKAASGSLYVLGRNKAEDQPTEIESASFF